MQFPIPQIELRSFAAAVLTLLLVTVEAGSASAQTIPQAFAALGQHLKPGDTLYVTGLDSVEATGRFVRLSPTALVLAARDREREFLFGEVAQIERRGDSVMNGTLWGALWGGLVVGSASGSSCSPDCAKLVPLGALLGTAMGAPLGMLFDAVRRGRTLVYQAGSNPLVTFGPLLGPGQRGVVVSVRYPLSSVER
jgi:hypothetical protein